MTHPYVALVRDERWILLFGTGCTFWSSPGQTFFISLFMGAVSSDIGLGTAQLGALYLVATLGAAALLPLTGHWLDRVDARGYVVAVLVGLALACGAMAIATGPISLLLGFLLLRLTGQGLMTHVAVTTIARYFDRNRGRALSLVAMGFPLAEAIMPAIAVAMIASMGWRAAYAAVGAFVLFGAAPALSMLIRRAPRFTRSPARGGSGRRPRALDGLKIVVGTRFFWTALPILLYLPFSSTALVFHIGPIGAAREWSVELIAIGFTCYAFGHAAGLLFSGGLIDRFGGRNMLPLMNVPMLLGVASLGYFEGQWTAISLLGLMGISSGLVQTTMAAVWAEVFGVTRLATIRSFAAMLTVSGTALGPAAIGLLLESGLKVDGLCVVLIGTGATAALLAATEARRAMACS